MDFYNGQKPLRGDMLVDLKEHVASFASLKDRLYGAMGNNNPFL
jgi:hypothetical protein